MDSNMFHGILYLAIAGIIAIILSIGLGIYTVYDYYFIDDYVTISKNLEPVKVTIEGQDTLYTYKID